MGSDSTLKTTNPSFHLPFMVFGASIPGMHHRKDKLPCEDAFGYRNIEDSLVIAVADGVSSAKNGREGADIAVRRSLDAGAWLFREREKHPDKIIMEAISESRTALLSHAELEGQPLSSFATTLIVAYISKGRVWCAHVGDGAVVCISGKDLYTLSEPERCEYANETRVLTCHDWEQSLRISSGNADIVLLSTDGCQNVLLNRVNGVTHPYGPFILPLIRSLTDYIQNREDINSAIRDLLLSDRMQALSSDDMTLVIAMPVTGENI